MDDVAVLLEHVDLLDTLDGLDVQLLQGGLQLLVVGVGGPVDLLDLAAGSALASVAVSTGVGWRDSRMIVGRVEDTYPVEKLAYRWNFRRLVNRAWYCGPCRRSRE